MQKGQEIAGRFDCPQEGCGKTFCTRLALNRHASTHTTIKPFHCQFCDKSFASARTLQNHLRLHARTAHFVCIYPGCGHEFTGMAALNRHLSEHKAPEDAFEETEDVFEDPAVTQAIVAQLNSFNLPDFFSSRELPVPSQVATKSELVGDLDQARTRHVDRPHVSAKEA